MMGAEVAQSSEHREYLARRTFGSLDGLRCLSIAAVVWHHSEGGLQGFPPSSKGFLGVDLFFVISGFLIVTLLLRERDRTQHISLGRFYMRRTLRIFPIYYLLLFALAFLFVFVRPESGIAAAFLADLPYHLTYTSNWIRAGTFMAIAWSLATEEQFYLVWPLIEKTGRAVIPILVAALALNQAINFGLLDELLSSRLGLDRGHLEILQVTFTPILLGVALAHVLHDPRGYALFGRLLSPRWLPLLLVTGIVALCFVDDLSGWPRLSIHLLLTGLLAACVLREDHLLAPLLRWGPIARLGAISYGIYLYHFFGIHGADLVLPKLGIEIVGLRFSLALALTALLAELSSRFVEAPFLRLKERFASD